MIVGLIGLGWMSHVAVAQSFQVHAAPVLEAQADGFTKNGLGSPTVVWDSDQERYLMLFETRTTDPTPTCAYGEWAVGVAWSVDGIDWTVWDGPVLNPGSGFRTCVVAHPTALYEDGEVHVWFKAHDDVGPTGVGYAHGNVRVLTVEERTQQLEDRAQDLVDAELAAAEQLAIALDDYMGWLRGERNTLAHTSHDALMAGHDLDREIHAVGRDLDAGAEPDLPGLLGAAEALSDELDGATDPDAQAAQDETDALVAWLEAWVADSEALDQAQQDTQGSLDEVTSGGWTQEADFSIHGSSVLDVSRFGYPTVAKVGGEYTMILAKVPSLYVAKSTDRINWAFDSTPVLAPGVAPWAPDELYNPALVCDDRSGAAYHLYFGGRTMNLWWVQAGGWSDAWSLDGLSWSVNTQAYFEFTGRNAWRHWDVMRVGDETVVWFSDKDGMGRNRIQLAYTTPTWDPADIHDRICE